MNGNDINEMIKTCKYQTAAAQRNLEMAMRELARGDYDLGVEDLLYAMYHAGRASLASNIARHHAPESVEAAATREIHTSITARIEEIAHNAMEAAHA